MSNVESLITLLNQTFPGSNWEGFGTYVYIKSYDLNRFHRIMEQKFPQELWLTFVHLPDIGIILYAEKYNTFLGWSKQKFPLIEEKTVSYQDVDKVLTLLSSIASVNARYGPQKINYKGLFIEYPRTTNMREIFSKEMSAYFVIKDNHLFIPLANIKIVIDYLEQTFPLHYPTPGLIAKKLYTYLEHLANKLGLDEIKIYSSVIRGSQIQLDKLSEALPIPLELKMRHGGVLADYLILNKEAIYEKLWDTVINDSFRRQISDQFLDTYTIRELNTLIGEYIVQSDQYDRLWEREVFDISRREYLKELLDLPPELNNLISAYI